MMKSKIGNLFIAALFMFFANAVFAQTTEFTYQGKLNDGGNPANANYDFEFRLFGVASGGIQVGSTNARNGVVVTGGIFTVTLDFSASFASGADRYIEISVSPAGAGTFTILNPRQKILSAPYTIRSQTASTANTANSAIVFTGNLVGDVTGPQGATVVSTVGGQTAANVATAVQSVTAATSANTANALVRRDASGGFSAGIINAAAQYNIGGNPVLSIPGTSNTFAGVAAGTANTTGTNNSIFGNSAGTTNTTGAGNSFFGREAGRLTTVGDNSFFGHESGENNSTGTGNSFFGARAGRAMTSGNSNVFVGLNTGEVFSTGSNNVFIGDNTGGQAFSSGSNNTALGSGAQVGNNTTFATAIGANAVALFSNTIVLGRSLDGVSIPGNLAVAGNAFVNGNLAVSTLGAAGATALCRNGSLQIATCSSSLRYKTNIGAFTSGLGLVNRLKPITFDWKDGGMHDLGLGAEDVAAIEPLLVHYNDKGEIEGVKYERVAVVLINAVKELQTQISAQGEIIKKQNLEIQRLRAETKSLRRFVASTKQPSYRRQGRK